MYWATPRMLMIDGEVIDAVAGYEHGSYDLPASTCLARETVDGRTWGVPFHAHGGPNAKDPIEELLPLFDQAQDKEVVTQTSRWHDQHVYHAIFLPRRSTAQDYEELAGSVAALSSSPPTRHLCAIFPVRELFARIRPML
jgi:hypothetical protein